MTEAHRGRRYFLMAKPIEATPVLRGQDAIAFLKSLDKKQSAKNKLRRKSAYSLLQKVSK